MCGIFGAIGCGCVAGVREALRLLEYRGYDSVGVAARLNGTLEIVKQTGRVKSLVIPEKWKGADCVIGHTRWATHGAVSQVNAHPFASNDGSFAAVHNGVLDNYTALKGFLEERTFEFLSQTDSEIIPQLLQYNFHGSVLQAAVDTARMLSGSFAVAFQSLHDGRLYAFRHKSPLVVGVCNGHAYVSSDIRCISHFAERVAVLPNDSVAVMSADSIEVYGFDGVEVKLSFFDAERSELPPEGEVMLSEIFAVPQAIRNAKSRYFDRGGTGLSREVLKDVRRIYLIGCGTAYHSGLQAAAVARKWLSVDVVPIIASEFACGHYPIDRHTLAFFISQSGETADTLRACEFFIERGGLACAITNTDNSSITRLCLHTLNVGAGAEYAVASTKAYNCQLITLLLALSEISVAQNGMSAEFKTEIAKQIDVAANAAEALLNKSNEIALLARQIKDSTAVFFIGRGCDYPTACEGSLKLKEISYIHSEAYPAGELKHGSLALIEPSVTVVALATDINLLDKTECSVAEVRARGARVVCVSPFDTCAELIRLPVVADYLYGIISVIPLQLLAYHAARALGHDVDRPRNLAKSVTVE